MLGNAWELVWTYGDVFDPDKHDAQIALGGDFHGDGDPMAAERAASPYGDTPFDGSYNVGFRIVCRKASLPAPPAGEVTDANCPVWRIKKGQKTQVRKTPERAAAPVLDMVSVPGGTFRHPESRLELTMRPFEMGKNEVTFAKWQAVKQWAEANGYTFGREGDMGSMYWYAFAHAPDEPVTFITWHDAVVWCNALSEMEGRTPVYCIDEAKTEVYRRAHAYRPIKVAGWELVDTQHPLKQYGSPRGNEPWLFERWDADGYRLPTEAEFEYALQGGTGNRFFWGSKGNPDDYGWSIFNSGGRTHAVDGKAPNPFGLFDMIGNVYEYSNSGGQPKSRDARYDTNNPKRSRYWARGIKKYQYSIIANPYRMGGSWFWGGIHSHFNFYEMAHEYMPDYGFRVVRCEAGTHPPDGNFPIIIPVLLVFDEKDYDDLAGAAYRGSIRRDGVHQTAGVAELVGIKWQVSLGGPVRSSPVVVDNLVYIGGPKGFHALEAETGDEKWSIPIKAGVTSSACIAKGVVYFTGRDGNVYAADAGTGAVKWKKKPKGARSLESGPAAAYGTVFVYSGGTVGVDAETGREFWHCSGGMKGRAAVALHPKYVISGGSAFRLDVGQLLFSSAHLIDWTSDADLTSCVVGDMYYGASSGRGGYAFAKIGSGDLIAMHKKWGQFIEAQLPQPKRSYSSCSPAVWDGKVYIGVEKGLVYAFDAMRGNNLDWTFNAGKDNGLHSAPSVAARSGIIYFGSQSGEFFAVDARTAQEKWRTKLGGPIETSPWPADGVIYVSCDDGNVYALEGKKE